MACPNCKTNMSGKVTVSSDPQAPWYKPTGTLFRCNNCDVTFKQKELPKKVYGISLFAGLFTLSAYVSPGCVGGCEVITAAIGGIAVLGLVMGMLINEYEIVS